LHRTGQTGPNAEFRSHCKKIAASALLARRTEEHVRSRSGWPASFKRRASRWPFPYNSTGFEGEETMALVAPNAEVGFASMLVLLALTSSVLAGDADVGRCADAYERAHRARDRPLPVHRARRGAKTDHLAATTWGVCVLTNPVSRAACFDDYGS
jgi:hypothetical protein